MCRTTRDRIIKWINIGCATINMLFLAIAIPFLFTSDTNSNADKEINAIEIVSTDVITTEDYITSNPTTTTTTTTTTEKVHIINPGNNVLKMSQYKTLATLYAKQIAEIMETETTIPVTTCTTTSTTTSATTTTTCVTTTTVDADVFLLAQVIEAEGGSIPLEARARIGSVVINRLHSNLFPNSIYDIAYSGEYETVNKGLLPEIPTDENLELASFLIDLGNDSEEWYQYCLDINISDKTVFQANSSINMHSYAYKILDEYGSTEYGYCWHMCYWESMLDYSDYGIYSEIHIYP